MTGASRSWAELRELLGEGVAWRVVDRLGGEQVTVPRLLRPGGCLRDAIGDEQLYVRIVNEWGGCQVYIPEMSTIVRADRNERIRGRRAAGASAREIAREEGLSVRQVRNIVSRGVGCK